MSSSAQRAWCWGLVVYRDEGSPTKATAFIRTGWSGCFTGWAVDAAAGVDLGNKARLSHVPSPPHMPWLGWMQALALAGKRHTHLGDALIL